MIKPNTKKVKKYKYTRKEIVDAWLKYRNIEGDFGRNLKDDLLAQKEDKKECIHCGSKTLKHKNYCYLHHPFENEEGIDWSKKDIYDGIKRPDLRPNLSSEKECRHKWSIDFDINCKYCEKCGKEISIKTPTPSPLEIEEIETLKHRFMSGKNHCWRELSLQDQKINSLIRNQKKLYQLIKEKL